MCHFDWLVLKYPERRVFPCCRLLLNSFLVRVVFLRDFSKLVRRVSRGGSLFSVLKSSKSDCRAAWMAIPKPRNLFLGVGIFKRLR